MQTRLRILVKLFAEWIKISLNFAFSLRYLLTEDILINIGIMDEIMTITASKMIEQICLTSEKALYNEKIL